MAAGASSGAKGGGGGAGNGNIYGISVGGDSYPQASVLSAAANAAVAALSSTTNSATAAAAAAAASNAAASVHDPSLRAWSSLGRFQPSSYGHNQLYSSGRRGAGGAVGLGGGSSSGGGGIARDMFSGVGGGGGGGAGAGCGSDGGVVVAAPVPHGNPKEQYAKQLVERRNRLERQQRVRGKWGRSRWG